MTENRRWAPLAWGFRPFFLLAGLMALIAVPIWLVLLRSGMAFAGHVPASLWHGHEMLYGFLSAAIAGFLLTAVPNWTGSVSISGWPLLKLVILWLVGRLAFASSGYLPSALVLIAPLLFMPFVFFVVARQLWSSDNRRLPILCIIFAYWLSEVIFMVAVWNDSWTVASTALRAGIGIVLILITLIGGRIIPVFTANALRKRDAGIKTPMTPRLDRAVLIFMVIYVGSELIAPTSQLMLVASASAGILQLYRFAHWHGLKSWREPIVWILHAGYVMLPLGLLLRSVYLATGIAWSIHWQHLLTMGAASTMVVAVMSRAALGHTGRPLQAARVTVAAYVALLLSVVVRVFGITFMPTYTAVTSVAGGLWAVAFFMFLIVYAPILTKAREDGQTRSG